jgi:Mannosyl-glycoprotein endo-beta-N-acetylglucosaminidase
MERAQETAMSHAMPRCNDRPRGRRPAAAILVAAIVGGLILTSAAMPAHAAPPPIRVTSDNRMPGCVTPERLMAYLRERNPALDSRFSDIAKWYKAHGETWRVRWDYAFFQMIIETNHLSYRTGSGGWGDVNPKQNNFAGIGTTGGGVPGDGYPDVSTGVLAQMQHLVAYSGERLDRPVAPRTQLTQDDIIAISQRLKRPVTFGDLAGRWAVDRRYARSIESVAERFRASQCTGREQVVQEARSGSDFEQKTARTKDKRWVNPDLPPAIASGSRPDLAPPKLVREPTQVVYAQRSSLGGRSFAAAAIAGPVSAAPPATCRVQAASYVGRGTTSKALLIRATVDGEQHYTALQVLDGFERSMADSFIAARAPGGATVGDFDSGDAALAKAYELCPAAR